MSSSASWTLTSPSSTPSTTPASDYSAFPEVDELFFASTTVAVVDGDAVLTSTGDLEAAEEPIAEEVAFSINTLLGSFGGQATLGNGILTVHIFNGTSYIQVRDAVDRALLPMVIAKTIKDVDVIPTPRMRGATAVNEYMVTYRLTGVVDR